eukprot:gb/GFBE01059955.1/.p1 GENE.gb/GFBE01059955.1/~~gb/GFBE01059955.1/.p1  ORF type:complete len:416 (+),score=73.30 gb/GFBE01059955.1/:1-1248(+)
MSVLRAFGLSCPCIARECKEDRDPAAVEEDGIVTPGRNGCYLANFKGDFPAIPSTQPLLVAPVGGAVDSFAQRNKELGKYLYNDVKVCAKCGRPCAWTQKACQGCGTSLADVPISQTENVMMGFIFGVERTTKLPLVISLRRQTENTMVFDDLLAMSSCHFNALLTSHYCQDWRWLLRDPKTAKGILRELEHEAWQATLTFLQDEKWRKFVYREGVTEDMVRANIICGFNSPPSQFQLHLQWIVLPLMPFHHQKLLDGTHAQKGRWFPLEYVHQVLDLLAEAGETFDVHAQTSTDTIVQHFNGRGVNYDEIWARCYERYCASYALSNWNSSDFNNVVLNGKAHEIQEVLPGGRVRLGAAVELDTVSTQAQDKLKLQNYGRRFGSNGTPGGTYYKHHKATKIGEGGIKIWPGLERS